MPAAAAGFVCRVRGRPCADAGLRAIPGAVVKEVNQCTSRMTARLTPGLLNGHEGAGWAGEAGNTDRDWQERRMRRVRCTRHRTRDRNRTAYSLRSPPRVPTILPVLPIPPFPPELSMPDWLSGITKRPAPG